MFAIAGHEIGLDALITLFGAVCALLVSLGYFKAKFEALQKDHSELRTQLHQDRDDLRDHLEARDMKLEAELKIMSDSNAVWREGAVGRFATRDELANANGIAKAIREIGERIIDLARRT